MESQSYPDDLQCKFCPFEKYTFGLLGRSICLFRDTEVWERTGRDKTSMCIAFMKSRTPPGPNSNKTIVMI